MKKRQDKLDRGEDLWWLTSRKVLMLGILFSSMRSRKAFSWLLQYSPYTEKLSLCKKVERNTGQVCRPGTWYTILLGSWQPWEIYCDNWQGADWQFREHTHTHTYIYIYMIHNDIYIYTYTHTHIHVTMKEYWLSELYELFCTCFYEHHLTYFSFSK